VPESDAHQLGVKSLSRIVPQESSHPIYGPGGLVRANREERIHDIDKSDDPRSEGNGLTRNAKWISFSIKTLVMKEDSPMYRGRNLVAKVQKGAKPERRMKPHDVRL